MLGSDYSDWTSYPWTISNKFKNVSFQIKRKERERAEKADSKERGGGSEDKEKAAVAELSS